MTTMAGFSAPELPEFPQSLKQGSAEFRDQYAHGRARTREGWPPPCLGFWLRVRARARGRDQAPPDFAAQYARPREGISEPYRARARGSWRIG